MQNNELRKKIAGLIYLLDGIFPIMFWIFLVFGFDEPYVAVITVICALVHECGHEMFFLFRFGKIRHVNGALSGFRIKNELNLSYLDEVILYALGPTANIAAVIMALPFLHMSKQYITVFIIINLITAISNLLPIPGYDGFGIIKSLMGHFNSGSLSDRMLNSFSNVFISLMCFVSLYLMDRCDGGYWIFAVFIVSLLSSISQGLKSVKNEIL